MSVWQSNSIEKNFDELVADIQKVKEWTLNKFKALEDSTNLKKIQYFKPLLLEHINVRCYEDTSWYSRGVKIFIGFSFEYEKYAPEHLKRKDRIEISISDSDSSKNRLFALKEFIEEVAKHDMETHKINMQIREDNKQLETQIFKLLEQVGIRKTYWGRKNNRSTKDVELYYEFPSEIRRQIPTWYSDNKVEDLKKQLIEKIDNIFNTELKKIQEEKRRKELEEKQKRANKTLALLLAKYDLELDQSWDDLLELIVSKNKYLQLAKALENNRNDWSDGCSFAEWGLHNFKIETELDQEIYDDIIQYIDEWDKHMDGRVFRDCKYNYSVLYELAEKDAPELYKDYLKVCEHLED